MSRSIAHLREFARRLEVFEAKRKRVLGQETFLVCNKLGAHLATLLGASGFQALLRRALALAAAEAPRLGDVKINPDGSLEKPARLDPDVPAKLLAGDSIILVAEMLALLVLFVGERLTLQMVLEVWPKLPREDRDFGIGEIK